MECKRITKEILQKLEAIVGSENILCSDEATIDYAHDESFIIPHYPEVVARAGARYGTKRVPVCP